MLRGGCSVLLGQLLLWPTFTHFFYFLIIFIVGLLDMINALPEFCSVVSDEICGLQNLCAAM